MSKITFRADDDLVSQLEEFDASKSEVMREALRQFLGESEGEAGVNAPSDGRDGRDADSLDQRLDDLIRERVDEVVDERLEPEFTGNRGAYTATEPQDVNVNISLDGVSAASDGADEEASVSRRKTESKDGGEGENGGVQQCPQCGENVGEDHVYCPNCGEKATRRVFCDCGDELRSDWAFCPSCGRRTPAADVLDRS
jgi:rubrerythrin